MGYMERLGLWGAGNPAFSSFTDFMDAVGSRGVCALELVAMDMKAQGMYVARTLSYTGAPPQALLLRHAKTGLAMACASLQQHHSHAVPRTDAGALSPRGQQAGKSTCP